MAPVGAAPGFGDPQGLSYGADGSHAASHSEWAAADVPAGGGAERDTAGTAAFASATQSAVPGSGWQHPAYDGSEQSVAGRGAEASFSGAAAGYGDAWGASSGSGGNPAALPWQPPAEPGLPGDTGTAAQAPFAHAEAPADAAQAPPYGGMSFGGGGGYGTSPLQLSPPSVLDPAAAYAGAEAEPSANEWQPGVGPGTGSAAVVEDEMVELDF